MLYHVIPIFKTYASSSFFLCHHLKSFPTCQVRVVRFYVSWPASSSSLSPSSSSSARPQLQVLERNVPCRTPTATSGSKCPPPDLHRKLRIKVFPTGPQPQRTSEDIPDRMSERMSIYARKYVRIDAKFRMSEYMTERMSE